MTRKRGVKDFPRENLLKLERLLSGNGIKRCQKKKRKLNEERRDKGIFIVISLSALKKES